MTRNGQLSQTLNNEKTYPLIALYDPDTHLMRPNKMTKYGFPEETVYVAERLSKEHVSPEIIRSVTIEIDWIKQVLQVENPIHETELQRRIRWLSKRQAPNYPIGWRLSQGIQRGLQLGVIRQKDGFIWLANTHHVAARDRSTMPEPTRDIEMISDEEMQSAIELIVHDSIETGYEMYDRLTALLGSRGRPKENTHDLFKPLLNNLVRQGRLVEDSGVWRSAETSKKTQSH